MILLVGILLSCSVAYSMTADECYDKLRLVDSSNHIYERKEIGAYKVPGSGVDKCWVYMKLPLDSVKAKNKCNSLGGTFALPKSVEEDTALGDFFVAASPPEFSMCWIGMKRPSSGPYILDDDSGDTQIVYFGTGIDQVTTYSNGGGSLSTQVLLNTPSNQPPYRWEGRYADRTDYPYPYICEFKYEETVPGEYVSILPDVINNNGEHEFQGVYQEASAIGNLIEKIQNDLLAEGAYQEKILTDLKYARNAAIEEYDLQFDEYSVNLNHINVELEVVYNILDLLGDNIDYEPIMMKSLPLQEYEDACVTVVD